MKEAMFYRQLEGKKVQCNLCPHNCIIPDKKTGICRARKNKDGKLFSLIYGRLVSAAIDPIEKKPLFHFLPGTSTYSIASVGCNFHCLFCQNWQISQVKPEDILSKKYTPKQIIENAKHSNCKSIAYTYTEPSINYEFVLETAKLAKEQGIKNIMVTNGYINPEPLKKLYRYIDAVNVDLKSFDNKFYKNICSGNLAPVLESLKLIKSLNVHIETTTLLIPGHNDNPKEIKQMCIWIKENLGKDTPVHFSRFFPMYKMKDISPTPISALEKAKQTAINSGLIDVYIGNV